MKEISEINRKPDGGRGSYQQDMNGNKMEKNGKKERQRERLNKLKRGQAEETAAALTAHDAPCLLNVLRGSSYGLYVAWQCSFCSGAAVLQLDPDATMTY